MNFARSTARSLFANNQFKQFTGLSFVYLLQNQYQKHINFLEQPSTEVWIRGEYENKIRRHSSVEKVFEVFATKKKDNMILLMTFEDLLRAIVPFNYSTKDPEEITKYIKENPPLNVKKVFDLDLSNDISIIEYCLFFLFHEASVGSIKKFFRKDPTIDDPHEKITKKRMTEFLLNRAELIHFGVRTTILPDGRAGQIKEEELREAVNNFLKSCWDGKEEMHLHDLIDIKMQIRNDVFRYEFNTFEVKDGSIAGEDFYKSVLAYQDPRVSRKILKKDMWDPNAPRVTFQEFCNFKNFMMDNFKDFDATFERKGIMTKKSYYKVINEQTTRYNYPMSEFQKDALFHILDIDGNKKVDTDEFNKVLINLRHLGRNFYGRVNSESLAPIFDLKQEFFTFVDKAQRIWAIINE